MKPFYTLGSVAVVNEPPCDLAAGDASGTGVRVETGVRGRALTKGTRLRSCSGARRRSTCVRARVLYSGRMSDDRQAFTVTSGDNGSLVLVGELDAVTAPDLDEALAKRNGQREVTLDLSQLTFIDSHGLHTIVAFAQARDTVTLTGVAPHILRVLEITCLTEHPKLRIHG
jgi:anti-anti-sigma factor